MVHACRERFPTMGAAMSANGDAARRDMWAGRMERCLASGMAIGEWCSLNKVSKSSLYRRLAVFRDERLPALCGCFDARRCFRSDRVRCSLGVCVARCECRCRAHARDQRERKGDREHCGRGLFHGVTSLMADGGFTTHGTVLPCDICWRHFTTENLGITAQRGDFW